MLFTLLLYLYWATRRWFQAWDREDLEGHDSKKQGHNITSEQFFFSDHVANFSFTMLNLNSYTLHL